MSFNVHPWHSPIASFLVLAAVGISAPSSATTIWTAGTADWLTSSNWDTNAIPSFTDNAFVNNGGTAQISVLGIISIQDLNIGYDDGLVGPGSDGRVEGNAFSTQLSRDLAVGAIRGLGSGSIAGTLDISSPLNVGGNMHVGHLDGGAPGSGAIGVVDVSALVGSTSAILRIGHIDSAGPGSTAQGTVNVSSLSGFDLIDVGINSTSNASVIDSRLNAAGPINSAAVVATAGHSFGGGDTDGRIEADTINMSLLHSLQVGLIETGAGEAIGRFVDRTMSGTLNLLDSGVTFTNNVGSARGSATGNASGVLQAGDIVGDGGANLRVGHVESTSSATAQGTVTATSLSGIDVLSVARASATGTALDSKIVLSGALSDVGTSAFLVASSAGGDAEGSVTAGSLDFDTYLLLSGSINSGSGTVSGEVTDLSGAGTITLKETGGGARHEIGVVGFLSNGNATGTLGAGHIIGEGDAALGVGIVSGASGIAKGTVTAASLSELDVFNVGAAATGGTALESRVDVSGAISNVGVSSFVVGFGRGGDARGVVTAAEINTNTVHLVVGTSREGGGTVSGELVDTSGTGTVILNNGFTPHDIGVVGNSGNANATGVARLGSVIADPATTIRVGYVETTASGTANGTLELNRTSNVGNIAVGVNAGAGSAHGSLILHDDMTANLVVAGRNFTGLGGPGTADIELNSALFKAEQIALGEGSHTLFSIDGLLRGTEYGAIDTKFAALFDGATSQANFGFVPVSGFHEFDLLSAEIDTIAGTGGIQNEFSSFDVFGLASAFSWSTDYVIESGYEIFRLTIFSDTPAPMPEPATLMLFLLGLAGLRYQRIRCVQPRGEDHRGR